MDGHDFLRNVGPNELHDATLLRVEQEGDVLRVALRTHEGRTIRLEFSGVTQVRAVHPEGLLLYALREMRSQAPERRFVFANWDEADDATLEIVARDLTVSVEVP